MLLMVSILSRIDFTQILTITLPTMFAWGSLYKSHSFGWLLDVSLAISWLLVDSWSIIGILLVCVVNSKL